MTSPLDYLETEIVLSDTEELPALRRNSVTVQTATSSRQSTSSIESGSEKDATEDVNTRPTAAAPTFLEVDYTSSQRPDDGCLSLEKMSSMKVFRVKRKQGVQNISIVRIYKNQLEDVITILSQKLDIPRGDRIRVSFTYPLRNKNGDPEHITVNAWEPCLTDALELFYCQTESHALLEVDVSSKRPKRPPRKSETDKKAMQAHGTIDKKMYQMLIDNPNIAEALLLKRKYIAKLLGDKDAVNLLNPTRYLCHVQGCDIILHLKSYSNLSSITYPVSPVVIDHVYL